MVGMWNKGNFGDKHDRSVYHGENLNYVVVWIAEKQSSMSEVLINGPFDDNDLFAKKI